MIERERLKPNIPIDRKLINKCLMLANSVICEKVIKMWISEYTPLFECTTELRRTIAKGDEQGLAITLFPHEFLFLMCNGKKRNPLVYIYIYIYICIIQCNLIAEEHTKTKEEIPTSR